MARFYAEATWRDGGVDVECYRIDPLPPDRAARLIERGMLKADDEQVGQVKVGALVVDYPDGGYPKRVRRAIAEWLAEHAGYGDGDSIDILMSTEDVRGLLERLEAAVSA